MSDESFTRNHIYVLLTLNPENLMRVASKYRIKKELDYTAIDFYLNEAVSEDQRPVKTNSVVRSDEEQIQMLKRINRYFKLPDKIDTTTASIEEVELPFEDIMQFDSYCE